MKLGSLVQSLAGRVLSVIFLGSVISSTVLANAGGFNGGGGGAAVCRNWLKKVSSARLLDLYEGRVRFKYKIENSNLSPQEQLEQALSGIPSRFNELLIRQNVHQTLSSFQFLPKGVGLAPTTDLGRGYGVVVPEGCAIEPIGYYEADGTLMVSQEIFRALSKTDRAAFILHEAIYKIARETALAEDSALSRKAVAMIFAAGVDQKELTRILEKLNFQPNVTIRPQATRVFVPRLNQQFKIRTFAEAEYIFSVRCEKDGAVTEKYAGMEKAIGAQTLTLDDHGCSSIQIWIPGVGTPFELEITDSSGGVLFHGKWTSKGSDQVPNHGVWIAIARTGQSPIPPVPSL